MQTWEENNDTGVIRFYGPISEWYISARDFDDTMNALEKKYKLIKIRVHCYGGSCFEGNVIYNRIATKKVPVHIYVDGIAASMGSIIMLPADKIFIAENALVMIHRPTMMEGGNADQMFQAGKLLKQLEKHFTTAYVRKSGQKESVVQQWFDGSDHWLGAEDCKAFGLADEIITPTVNTTEVVTLPADNTPIKNLFDKYSALLTSEHIPGPVNFLPIHQNTTMKKDLIAKFNLQGVDENSSDTALITKLDEIVAGYKSKVDNLTELNKKTLDGAVNAAIASFETKTGKKLTDAQKTTCTNLATGSGIDSLTAFFEMLEPVNTAGAAGTITDVTSLIKNEEKGGPNAQGAGLPQDRKAWDWDKWQKEDGDGLEALAKSNYEAFNALYKGKYKSDAPKD